MKLTADQNLLVCNLVQQGVPLKEAKAKVLTQSSSEESTDEGTDEDGDEGNDEDRIAELSLEIESLGAEPDGDTVEALEKQLSEIQQGL